MQEIAPGVHRLVLAPRDGLNAYLVGDVLVDAGLKASAKKILSAVDGHSVAAHALTHAHTDHAGGSKVVCEALGIPCWAGADDVAAVQTGDQVVPASPLRSVLSRVGFPGLPVERTLREGDEVSDFTVLDAPGHSPGHIALWRERDRVLICGDVWTNMSLFTTIVGLHQPPGPVTVDPELNRASERKLAALEPELALFGHGPPLHGAAAKLQAFVAA